jgi:hypothetical protein
MGVAVTVADTTIIGADSTANARIRLNQRLSLDLTGILSS